MPEFRRIFGNKGTGLPQVLWEPTIYPVLAAWGFTTEENRVPSDAEITTGAEGA